MNILLSTFWVFFEIFLSHQASLVLLIVKDFKGMKENKKESFFSSLYGVEKEVYIQLVLVFIYLWWN